MPSKMLQSKQKHPRFNKFIKMVFNVKDHFFLE